MAQLSDLILRFQEEREVLLSLKYRKSELIKLPKYEKDFLRERFKELRLAPFDDVLEELKLTDGTRVISDGVMKYQYFGIFTIRGLARFLKKRPEFFINLTKKRTLKVENGETIVISFQNFNKELGKYELDYIVREFDNVDEAKNFVYNTYRTEIREVFYKKRGVNC